MPTRNFVKFRRRFSTMAHEMQLTSHLAEGRRGRRLLLSDSVGRGLEVRVMIFEKEPLLQVHLEEELKLAGFEIVGPATSDREALDLVESDTFHAALLGGDDAEYKHLAKFLSLHGVPTVVLCCSAAKVRWRLDNIVVLNRPLATEVLTAVLERFCRSAEKARC